LTGGPFLLLQFMDFIFDYFTTKLSYQRAK